MWNIPPHLPRSFPSRCCRSSASTFPPALRRTAPTPRPARRNASSANHRQELPVLLQHVVPPTIKSTSCQPVDWWQSPRAVWRIFICEERIYTLWSNEREGITVGWRLSLLFFRGRGHCWGIFLLMYPCMLKSKIFKHLQCSVSLRIRRPPSSLVRHLFTCPPSLYFLFVLLFHAAVLPFHKLFHKCFHPCRSLFFSDALPVSALTLVYISPVVPSATVPEKGKKIK